eukprot:3968096-Ditylum_brightwellii.AAC.1
MMASVDFISLNKSTMNYDAKEAVTKEVVNNRAQGPVREGIEQVDRCKKIDSQYFLTNCPNTC